MAQFGYVQGRFLLVVGDTTSDPDRDPDVIPASGAVTLMPVAPIRVLGGATPALAVTQPVRCALDSEGYLTDPAGARGVYLVPGTYTVSLAVPQVSVRDFYIDVTTAHTEAAPLDLTTAINVAVLPPAPVPTWQALTQGQYDALLAAGRLADGTVYLITGA